MSKNGFLIAIEGADNRGVRRMGERISKKLRRKGCDSVFGADPPVDLFGNYFRPIDSGGTADMISAVTNILDTALQFESFEPDINILCEARRIVCDFNDGKEISKIDLQLLSFFERKFHLRSVIGHLTSSNCFVVLKGYELSSFAEGLSAGISFEELFYLREKVLGRDHVRPDVTILLCAPVHRMDDLAINYEIAIARLQNTKNYGFVARVNGNRSEGLIMADIFRKLSRFIPVL